MRAVFDRLLHGATTGQLGELLGGRPPGSVPLAEVEETVRLFVAAGLRTETRYGDDWILAGLDLLVAGMIDTRDVGYVPELVEPDLAAVRALAADVAAQLKGVPGSTSGGRFLRDAAARCREVTATDSPAEAFRVLRETLRPREFKRKKRDDFDGQREPWKLYTTLRDTWKGQLVAPLSAWMGARLARLRFVVAELYEQVKAERAVLDQLDLLVKLRDVLRDRALVRRQLQALFDHVFVDEFQDTDPLQCEVVFFLCEAGAKADEWRRVQLRPGSLTVVGDPKQSIYRFRRADIAMYEEAHRLIREQGAFVAGLVTNFRSRPPLIHFANAQLGRLLGEGAERFDPRTGRVYYEPLAPDPAIAPAGPAVHVVPFGSDDGTHLKVGPGRALEADSIARRIRWLVGSSFNVRDPETGRARPVRYGDVAVLAHVTTNVPLLLRALDTLGIRYAAHGGTLFLSSPLVRRYLLGLRYVADRWDGVAEAALLRPPFFALDLADARVEDARAIVRELRRDRLARPPIETAIDLVERTALGRAAATGPNGPQALETLYQVAFELGRRAAEAGLDYDGVTREMRAWVEDPIRLDPPDAADPGTVRVMTVHQAKGLEFPVVVLWDAFSDRRPRLMGCWRVARTEDGIVLAIEGLSAEVPPGGHALVGARRRAGARRARCRSGNRGDDRGGGPVVRGGARRGRRAGRRPDGDDGLCARAAAGRGRGRGRGPARAAPQGGAVAVRPDLRVDGAPDDRARADRRERDDRRHRPPRRRRARARGAPRRGGGRRRARARSGGGAWRRGDSDGVPGVHGRPGRDAAGRLHRPARGA